MKRSEHPVKRTYPMLIASYWLSRCGVQQGAQVASPPAALGVETWKDAYYRFYDAMGDGRSPRSFSNSMKNARDVFDTLFDNGRIGWVNRDGDQPPLSASFQRVHDEWRTRSDDELESFVLGLVAGLPAATEGAVHNPQARTEGGKKVYVSVRQERDPKLRDDAIALHGLDCMACKFNFEDRYGALGKGFVEVHHVVPLTQRGKSDTNPETDLVVLCANCHRMVHRNRDVCLSLEELKSHIKPSDGMP
ncbi:hypothetical protein C6W92_06560 [Roseovarius sp. A46]|nr:hypothetical protein C6W92_06560 [Roseovarius sp. A46]